MTNNINELFLDPGDLAELFASCGIAVSSQSPLAGSPLLEPSASAKAVTEIAPGVNSEELNTALQALAMPALVIAGLRGVRRMEPWPFLICRRPGSPAGERLMGYFEKALLAAVLIGALSGLVGTLVVLPAILGYTAYVYRVFRGKSGPLDYG